MPPLLHVAWAVTSRGCARRAASRCRAVRCSRTCMRSATTTATAAPCPRKPRLTLPHLLAHARPAARSAPSGGQSQVGHDRRGHILWREKLFFRHLHLFASVFLIDVLDRLFSSSILLQAGPSVPSPSQPRMAVISISSFFSTASSFFFSFSCAPPSDIALFIVLVTLTGSRYCSPYEPHGFR